jgi:3-hydroxyacyl-CoA dehydrogenase
LEIALKGKINYKVIDGIAVLEVDNPPVNPLSDGVRHGLVESMEKAESDDSVVGIVLTGKGRSFIAGADISEFGQQIEGPRYMMLLKKLKNHLNLLLLQLMDLLLVVD